MNTKVTLKEIFNKHNISSEEAIDMIVDWTIDLNMQNVLLMGSKYMEKGGISKEELTMGGNSQGPAVEKEEEKDFYDIELTGFKEGVLTKMEARKLLTELAGYSNTRISPIDLIKIYKGLTDENAKQSYEFKAIPKGELPKLEKNGFTLNKL